MKKNFSNTFEQMEEFKKIKKDGIKSVLKTAEFALLGVAVMSFEFFAMPASERFLLPPLIIGGSLTCLSIVKMIKEIKKIKENYKHIKEEEGKIK